MSHGVRGYQSRASTGSCRSRPSGSGRLPRGAADAHRAEAHGGATRLRLRRLDRERVARADVVLVLRDVDEAHALAGVAGTGDLHGERHGGGDGHLRHDRDPLRALLPLEAHVAALGARGLLGQQAAGDHELLVLDRERRGELPVGRDPEDVAFDEAARQRRDVECVLVVHQRRELRDDLAGGVRGRLPGDAEAAAEAHVERGEGRARRRIGHERGGGDGRLVEDVERRPAVLQGRVRRQVLPLEGGVHLGRGADADGHGNQLRCGVGVNGAEGDGVRASRIITLRIECSSEGELPIRGRQGRRAVLRRRRDRVGDRAERACARDHRQEPSVNRPRRQAESLTGPDTSRPHRRRPAGRPGCPRSVP